MSFIKKYNFINIQGWMVTELKLSGNELFVFAIIYGFTQDGEQWFEGSRQYLADWCNSTKPGIQKNLKSLTEKGYLLKEEVFINNVKFCKYKANPEILGEITPNEQSSLHISENTPSKQSLPPPVNKVYHPSKQSLPNNIDNNINKNIDFYKEKYKKENFESDTITTNFQNFPVEDMKKEVPKKAPLKEIEISFGDIIEPPKENINTGKVSKEELTKIEKLDKKTKHKYGEYQNVLLTDEELAKLKTEFPNDFEIRIEQLSEYIEIKAPKYKNHLAVIRAWARKDAEKIKAIEANYSFSVEKYENDEPDFDALNRMLEKQPKRRT